MAVGRRCLTKTYQQACPSLGCFGRLRYAIRAYFAPKYFYYVARHSNDKSVGIEVGPWVHAPTRAVGIEVGACSHQGRAGEALSSPPTTRLTAWHGRPIHARLSDTLLPHPYYRL